jgi:hypothetical protein
MHINAHYDTLSHGSGPAGPSRRIRPKGPAPEGVLRLRSAFYEFSEGLMRVSFDGQPDPGPWAGAPSGRVVVRWPSVEMARHREEIDQQRDHDDQPEPGTREELDGPEEEQYDDREHEGPQFLVPEPEGHGEDHRADQ